MERTMTYSMTYYICKEEPLAEHPADSAAQCAHQQRWHLLPLHLSQLSSGEAFGHCSLSHKHVTPLCIAHVSQGLPFYGHLAAAAPTTLGNLGSRRPRPAAAHTATTIGSAHTHTPTWAGVASAQQTCLSAAAGPGLCTHTAHSQLTAALPAAAVLYCHEHSLWWWYPACCHPGPPPSPSSVQTCVAHTTMDTV
jgi:hypothetical protein